MKIKFQRTGGFANIPVNVELDTQTLTEDNTNKIVTLVNKLHQPAAGEPVADGCSYKLDVTGDNNKSITADDGNVTDDMQELFNLLVDLS